MSSVSSGRRAPSREGSTRDPVRRLLRVGAVCLGVVVLLLLAGYVEHWRWTGYRDERGQVRPLWDWLTLLLEPLTLALLPLWLRSRHRRTDAWKVAAAAAAVVLLVLVLGGYLLDWTWTGFHGNTLWDWLDLFLMPFLMPLVLLLVVASGGPAVAAPPRAGRLPVLRPAVAVAAGFLLLTAGFGIGRIGSGGAGAVPRKPQPTPAPARVTVQRVTVDARDPFWTDTGLTVRRYEQVRVTAFGSVVPHTSSTAPWKPVGPAGYYHGGAKSIRRRWPHAALLARVGQPGQALRLSAPPSRDAVRVGGGHRFSAPSDGELFLGLNDRKTSDNDGYFDVVLTLAAR